MTRLQLLRRRLALDPPGAGAAFYPRTYPMTFSATARVPTASASKYLQQTCKHWEHNLQVSFAPDHGTIVFPKDARGANHPGDATVTFDAHPGMLEVRIDATSPDQLEGLKGAVVRHVDRFAFREGALRYDWIDS
jgi:uncharacterized protein